MVLRTIELIAAAALAALTFAGQPDETAPLAEEATALEVAGEQASDPEAPEPPSDPEAPELLQEARAAHESEKHALAVRRYGEVLEKLPEYEIA